MYACSNLFIHLLEHPGQASTGANLTMLEVGVGHFARLEVITQSRYRTSIVREMAHFAREKIAAFTAGTSDNTARLSDRNNERIPEIMEADPIIYPTELTGTMDVPETVSVFLSS